MKFVFAFVICAVVSGCTSISSSPRRFVIEESWVRSTTAKEFIGYRRMNRMAPLIYKNMLIQSNSIDGIVSYNRVTGNEFWRLKLRNGVEGGAVIADERLYFGASDGNFYCVDPTNGKVLWSFATHVETLASPTVEKSVVYFETAVGVVYALDAITGKQIWLYNRGTTQNLTVRAGTQPVIDGENLLVGFSDGFLVSLRKRDGILVWDKKLAFTGRFKDVDSTPVIDDNRLYVSSFDGALYCLKRENGEINWQHDEGGYTAAVILQDRLFYATSNGLIQALDKVSGKVLWSHPVKKGIATQPNLFRGYLIYGESEAGLVVANAETGKLIARFDPGHGLVAQPTVDKVNGDVFFISNSANIFAMKFKFERSAERFPWQN